MKNYRGAKFALSIIVSLLIILLLFKKVNLSSVATTIRGTNVWLLSAALAVTIFARYILASDRWRRVLGFSGCRMPLWEVILGRAGSAPIKFILPAKAGELVRAAYVANNKGLPLEASVGSIVFDKLLSFASITAFVIFGLPFATLHVSAAVLVVLFSGAVFSLLIGGVWKYPIGLAYKVHPRIGKLASGLVSPFEAIPLGAKAGLIAYSIAIEYSEIINSYLIFKSLGVEVPLLAIMGLAPLRIFLSSLPFTLSGIGATELGTLFLFAGYGTREALLGVGILVSFAQYIFPALFGIAFLGPFLARLSGAGLSLKRAMALGAGADESAR